MRFSLILLLILFLAACAATHDKLEAYIGQDIQHVVADYGYPYLAYDMGDGRRDFQWVVARSEPVAAQLVSKGALRGQADMFNPDIKMTMITPTYAGRPVASECLYTFITRWDESGEIWVVTGNQKPRTGC